MKYLLKLLSISILHKIYPLSANICAISPYPLLHPGYTFTALLCDNYDVIVRRLHRNRQTFTM